MQGNVACVCFSQGKKWWMNADEPWQALACCMEISNAVRSPNPAVFVSHFPVHQVLTAHELFLFVVLNGNMKRAYSQTQQTKNSKCIIYHFSKTKLKDIR